MKTIVKTAEMLSAFNDIEDAKLVSSTLAFIESELDAENAIATFATVIGAKPTFARFEMGRIRFVETCEGQGLSAEAIRQRSSRFFRRLGIDKPKSVNPESVKKAEQRAKVRDAYKGQSDAELAKQTKTLLANPTLENITKAGKVQKELAMRVKDAEKSDSDELKKLRDNLRDWIKTADYAKLQDAWHYVAGR
jgi:hypothetical protein